MIFNQAGSHDKRIDKATLSWNKLVPNASYSMTFGSDDVCLSNKRQISWERTRAGDQEVIGAKNMYTSSNIYGVISRPMPMKLLSLASPGFKPKGRMCEERTLRRFQTGQAQFGLSSKANECSGTRTGDLGRLPTHKTSPHCHQYE